MRHITQTAITLILLGAGIAAVWMGYIVHMALKFGATNAGYVVEEQLSLITLIVCVFMGLFNVLQATAIYLVVKELKNGKESWLWLLISLTPVVGIFAPHLMGLDDHQIKPPRPQPTLDQLYQTTTQKDENPPPPKLDEIENFETFHRMGDNS